MVESAGSSLTEHQRKWLEPYAYLRYLFTELPKAETVDAIESLLPSNLDADQIKMG